MCPLRQWVSRRSLAVALPAAAAGAAEEVEERLNLMLSSLARKIDVIKVIRQPPTGLVEAKTMADRYSGSHPGWQEAAQDAKKKLEEAGAAIELA